MRPIQGSILRHGGPTPLSRINACMYPLPFLLSSVSRFLCGLTLFPLPHPSFPSFRWLYQSPSWFPLLSRELLLLHPCVPNCSACVLVSLSPSLSLSSQQLRVLCRSCGACRCASEALQRHSPCERKKLYWLGFELLVLAPVDRFNVVTDS